MSKPVDFYVGVLDFFAIILPGAIATAILAPRIDRLNLGTLISIPAGKSAQWVVFLVSSYFVGHLVFLAGSYVDPIFHKWRERYRKRKPGSPHACAKNIRDSMLTSDEQSALNTFQWARSVLIVKFAAAAADIHRLEADSKFFRSLLILCVVVSLVLLAERRTFVGLLFAALAIVCTLRYGERRLKSEKQADMHIVAFHSLGLLGTSKANLELAISTNSDDA